MAFSRTEAFPKRERELADFLKALSHPARLAILRSLAQKKSCICGDLVTDLPLAQATVSQHLKTLKDAGLVKGIIDGPRSCYCIDWSVYNRFQELMRGFGDDVGRHVPGQPPDIVCE